MSEANSPVAEDPLARPPRVLIIAGSDSGGGAGIQADIKTVTMLGGFATTAITALTAQNTLGVTAVHPVPTDMVLAQMDAVLSDIGTDAVKIGMIGSAETAHAVAERLERLAGVPIVFDPVMVASSGSVLADEETVGAFDRLLRLSTVSTPNLAELGALSDYQIRDSGDRDRAVEIVMDRTACRALMVKGGHQLPSRTGDELNEAEDWLFDDQSNEWRWSGSWIDTTSNHGTGCTLASAIAVGLGQGLPLPDAVARARTFVRLAMREAPGFGAGHGPMGHQRLTLDLPAAGKPTLNQITLPASDYEASLAFYRRLGCTPIVLSPPRYARFEVPGGMTLSIEVKPIPVPPSQSEIFFQCDDVDDTVARLKAAGLSFDVEPEDRSYLWRVAETRDPHGNRICLYQTGEIRRYPPWRVKPSTTS